jgi:hypothetical protein
MKRRRRKSSLARKILWFFLLILAFTSLRTWYIQEQESHILEQERQQYQAQIDLLDAQKSSGCGTPWKTSPMTNTSKPWPGKT